MRSQVSRPAVIQSSHSVPPTLGAEFGERLERQVFAPARSMGVGLEVSVVTDPPPPIEFKQSPTGTWWVASSFDVDPIALSNGGLTTAPPDVVAELRALRAAGVDFEFIFILHELPKEWTPGTPIPRMQLAGTAGDDAAAVVNMQKAVLAAGLDALRATAQVAGVAARGIATAGAVAVAGMAVGVALDPVVMGGVKDPGSDRIAWVPLAAWDEVPSR